MIKINKSNNDKVRIRSPEELETRKNEFLKICEILENLKIKYFLVGGVLLGAIRNNGFIPWDWDVEICVHSDEVLPKIDTLLSVITNSNFSILKYDKNLLGLKIDFLGKLPKTVTKYTIMGWSHDKNINIFFRKTPTHSLKIPDHFMINMKKIRLFDRFFFAPHPVDEYLTHMYGDWKTPIQTSNKKEYLSKKYYSKNVVRDFIVKIINILKKYLKKLQ